MCIDPGVSPEHSWAEEGDIHSQKGRTNVILQEGTKGRRREEEGREGGRQGDAQLH